MIDFTNAIEEFNSYKGSEKKKTLIYQDKRYLVKFPDPIREKNKDISYINNAFSEYIGTNVFSICGFKAQNVILGKYKYNGKDKIVCSCEDFTDDTNILYEFENLALSTNPDKKIGTDIEDIMNVIEEARNMINTEETRQMFWNMFIIDCIIGNTDRHNGNWGFLLNKRTKAVALAPIYDCGSCLNPILEDNEMNDMNEAEFKNLTINCYSCLKENGKKINYISYIKQMKNEECNNAIRRIFDRINIDEISNFIDSINEISEVRKEYYKKIISNRYEIIKDVQKRLNK